MANFKVGDKVRITGAMTPSNQRYIGTETVITSGAFWHPQGVAYRTEFTDSFSAFAGIWEGHLAPLTDPRAKEFVEDMERFAHVTKRDPAPVH